MNWLSPQRYAAELEAQTAGLAAAVTRQPATAEVPACPGWTLRDLVSHVGAGHRYAAGIIERGATEPVPYRFQEAPAEQPAWPDWLTAGARRLDEAVRERGFSTPVWTFQPAHRTAGFWLRRMVHDEIIHRHDVDPAAVPEPETAADGISDLLLVFEAVAGPESPDPRWRQVTGSGETLRFSATDTGAHWLVTLGPAGLIWRTTGTAAEVTCRAPAADLLLILNRRRTPAADQVRGDRTLLDRWLESTRF